METLKKMGAGAEIKFSSESYGVGIVTFYNIIKQQFQLCIFDSNNNLKK
jgi:hypothetical protein